MENYDQTRKQKLLQLKITLNEKLETLKNLDEQILGSCKDDDIEAEILEAGSFWEQVLGISDRMMKFDFFFGAILSETVLSHSDNLSRTLQKGDISRVFDKN